MVRVYVQLMVIFFRGTAIASGVSEHNDMRVVPRRSKFINDGTQLKCPGSRQGCSSGCAAIKVPAVMNGTAHDGKEALINSREDFKSQNADVATLQKRAAVDPRGGTHDDFSCCCCTICWCLTSSVRIFSSCARNSAAVNGGVVVRVYVQLMVIFIRGTAIVSGVSEHNDMRVVPRRSKFINDGSQLKWQGNRQGCSSGCAVIKVPAVTQ